MRKELFLDANAHLPLNSYACKIYNEFVISKANHGHPSSLSEPGRLAATALEEARCKIAVLIGATSSNQIIFTYNCTHACLWAIDIFLNIKPNSSIAISDIEHPAMQRAFEYYREYHYKNVPLNILNVDINGNIIYDKYYDKIISIHMHNELGVVQSINKSQAKYTLLDMSQSLGKIPINVNEIDVDIAIFAAHKFGGPSGIGFIYLKNTEWWKPYTNNMGYYLDRPGTPDVANVIATAAALEDALISLSDRTRNMLEFQNTLEIGLENMNLKIIGKHAKYRSPNTTFVYGLKYARKTLLDLSDIGIYVGLGSACGSYHTNISPIMNKLNIECSIDNVMRISQWGKYNKNDAIYFLNILEKML